MDSDRLQPALYGGLFIGVLSALPVVNIGNCCCCLWVIAGGVLAVYLRQQNSPYQVTASEGALVGLLAGLIGGIVASVLSIPLAAMTASFQNEIFERVMSNPDMPAEARDAMERAMTQGGTAFRALGAVITVVIDTIFGMLGGLLGVALFKKNAPPPPPRGTVEVLPPQ